MFEPGQKAKQNGDRVHNCECAEGGDELVDVKVVDDEHDAIMQHKTHQSFEEQRQEAEIFIVFDILKNMVYDEEYAIPYIQRTRMTWNMTRSGSTGLFRLY